MSGPRPHRCPAGRRDPAPPGSGNAGLDLLDALGHLGDGEVLVAIVDGLELGAVDGNDRPGEQVELPAQHDKLRTRRTDGRSIVAAKVGNGLEVRHQATGQPHQLEVALGLAFQPPARLNAVEIAVDVDLEQGGGMVRWAARHLRHDAGKAQGREVELVDEDINNPNRIVFGHIVVQAVRKQGRLPTILTLNETLHRDLRRPRSA